MRLPTLALTFALVACSSNPSVQATGVTRQVSIQVTCDTESVKFTVTPWAQHLKAGDDISWTLTAASNTQDVTVDQVNGRWPFTSPPPVHSRPNNPGRVGHVKSGLPVKDTYHYTVEADCQSGTGPKIHGKIDPDMIID